MFIFLSTEFSRHCCKVSSICSSNYSVYDGECTYTHLSHAHFSGAHTLCIFRTSSCASHTCMFQVSVKRCLHMCHISPSRVLPSHDSPVLVFLDGHFETTPDYDLTDSNIHMFLPYFPVLKVKDMRHSAHASQSLATWPNQMQTQVMSPTSSTKLLPSMMTRCSSTIRTTISLTSRKPRKGALDYSVFTPCLDPLFRLFLTRMLLMR